MLAMQLAAMQKKHEKQAHPPNDHHSGTFTSDCERISMSKVEGNNALLRKKGVIPTNLRVAEAERHSLVAPLWTIMFSRCGRMLMV